MRKKFIGWVREWGQPWRVEASGYDEEEVRKNLAREFRGHNNTSTVVLQEGVPPQKNESEKAV